MLIEIDEERCVGCGSCVSDCVGVNLALEKGKARVLGRCIMCGHCVAICPTEAVSIPSYDMADVEPSAPARNTLDALALLQAVKSRRSIRDFRPRTVQDEALGLILQAGRYTATAKNSQGCRFIAVQERLPEFKELVWGSIDDLLGLPAARAPKWVKPFEAMSARRFADEPVDFLFRNAPMALFVAAERADDAGLAAQNMELVAASLGLGVLYNGYLCRVAEELSGARAFLEAGSKPLQLCMLVGYPAVSFPRTAPRLPGDFVVK